MFEGFGEGLLLVLVKCVVSADLFEDGDEGFGTLVGVLGIRCGFNW